MEHTDSFMYSADEDTEEMSRPAPVPESETESADSAEAVSLHEENKAGTVSDCAVRMQGIEAELLAAKQDIQTLNEHFRTVVTQTIALEKAVTAYYYEDGIVKICKLIEHVRRMDDEHAQIIADELASVLVRTFGLSVIQPDAGDLFDSADHERRDLSEDGILIRSCVMIGWKHNEKTLIRAIVETE